MIRVISRPSRARDTPIDALATDPTFKRLGHIRRAGFTGGNLEGVCVRHALWRPKARPDDPLASQQKGHEPCSI